MSKRRARRPEHRPAKTGSGVQSAHVPASRPRPSEAKADPPLTDDAAKTSAGLGIWPSRSAWIAAGVAASIVMVVYLMTLAPSIPPGDSGDLITSAVVLGIPHPPGYPLITILGHVFTLLPVGSPAYRVNLMSAIFGALAVAVVAALITRIARVAPGRDRPALLTVAAGVVGALILALSTQFWLYSVVAEVFALNSFFAAALLLLAFSWYRDPTKRWVLWLFFLTAGLASANQQTIVLLGPGLVVLLLGGMRRRTPPRSWLPDPAVRRWLVIGVGFLLLGLTPYLYLPLAAAGNPPVDWGNPQTLDAFVRVITRADYGSGQLVASGAHGSVGDNLLVFFSYLLDAFGVVGCALALAGAVALRRSRIVGTALVLAFLVSGPIFLAYANPPIPAGIFRGVVARFYILPSIPFAVVAGIGASEVLAAVHGVARSIRFARLAPVAIGAAVVVLLGVPLGPATAHWDVTDQSDNYQTRDLVEDILRPLQPNAILLTVGDTSILGGWYIQHAENYRPDVTVVAVPLLTAPWYVQQLRRQDPKLTVPFDVYDPANGADIGALVDANIRLRPVYYVGVISDRFPQNEDELRVGFTRQFVPKGDAPDPFAYDRAHLTELEQFHFPTRVYPDWTWEAWEAALYSSVAFDIANALETVDKGQAEVWYRRAINLGPENGGAYKNLAILLNGESRDHDEVVSLLQRFLALSPNDPDAPAIREFLAKSGS